VPLTQTQLASAVADRAEISRNEAKRVLAALEEVVLEELGNAQKVRVGGLVQLTVRVKPAQKARKGRNPATGEEITIAAKPASVDLRLGDSFRVFHNYRAESIDLRDPPENLTEEVVVGEDDSFVIHPGEFCLGRTLEWVELPDDIVARIEGKSSLGRLGLIVHATAGFCDPGWKGTLTLELNNLTRVPIVLAPGLKIAQLSFMTLDRPALRPYGSSGLGSHYQGQRAATASRYGSTPGDQQIG